MTKNKMKYEPFGDTLSVEVAYLQAAYLLDVAAATAIKLEDTERIQNLALSWMELGKLLISGGNMEEDDEEGDDELQAFVGFTNHTGEKMEIVSE